MKMTYELSYAELKVAITNYAQSRTSKPNGNFRIKIKRQDVGMNADPEYIAIIEEEDNGVTPVIPNVPVYRETKKD